MLLRSDSNPDIGIFQPYQPKRAAFRNNKSGLTHLTVNDMAFAGVKNHGNKEHLPGYFVKKWNNELEKPNLRNISKYEGGGMLESHLRSKKMVPSPSQYNV
jgi:hypothetical protein